MVVLLAPEEKLLGYAAESKVFANTMIISGTLTRVSGFVLLESVLT